VPFLKLTRDRRGFEHTYLLHTDAPGERPRILYWYRTAPDVAIGRPALDEAAIRQIEDQYPLIDFDWPAILALRDAMPPEDEMVPQGRDVRRERRGERRDEWRERGRSRATARPSAVSSVPRPAAAPMAGTAMDVSGASHAEIEGDEASQAWPDDLPDIELTDTPEEAGDGEAPLPASVHGLLEELVGREIATRLRARHAELLTRIHEQSFDDQARSEWLARADALDPDAWLSPHDILDGVQHADQRFDELRRRLTGR